MTTNGLYLQWEGKRLYTQRVPTPRVLEHVPSLSVLPSNGNRIIEGDNFQVLTSLRSQCVGKVDVVYLDPPYNLGKDDFRYSDKRFHDPDAEDDDATYVTNEDGGRHTKWLNFMAPRLYMLKQMMHDGRGVIFVSINDVELFRLGLLMDEIFGENNRVGIIVWKGATDNNPTRIAAEHEYILCYAKAKDKLPPQWSNPDNEAKALMLETYRQLKAEASSLVELQRTFAAFVKQEKDALGDLARYRHVDANGPYVARRNLDNPGKPGHSYDVLHKETGKPCAKPRWGWRFSEERMRELIAQDRIIFGRDETKIPELKVYLEEVEFPLRSVITLDSRAASNELEVLFGRRDVFKNAKPVDLIELLLSYTTHKDSLILDAFAGSGTTGEAVLRLNQRDGGSRRFILIEEGRGEDTYARTLTMERIKRAIAHHNYQTGFDVYRTGQAVDAEAIIGLQRESLANLICQADMTGRGKGITRVTGYRYIIGKNHRNEAICLVWNGVESREVTKDDLAGAAREVTAASLKRPFRIYGTYCRVGDTPSWQFCQIPDELLEQMRLR